MSDIAIYPFPYKLSLSGELNNGIFFDIPKFCRLNHNSNKCRDYYSSLRTKHGFHTCPYGFGSNVVNTGIKDIIFTCLNIRVYVN